MRWLKKLILIVWGFLKKRLDIIIDFVIIIFGLYCIYLGYININMLIKTVIIILLFISYKWVAHKVGISRGYLNKYMPFKEWLVDKESFNNKNNIRLKIILFLMNPNRVEKKWIMDIIFWCFRIIPFWNWVGSFVVWVWVMFFNMRVLIASNVDIYYRKRGKNKKIRSWSIYEWKYGWILDWVIIYPIYRILLYPDYIRQRIFDYTYLWEIVRIRIIVFFYGIIYLYTGYYEYIWGLNWEYWLILIYIYFAIVWPFIIYLSNKYGKKKWIEYYKPTIKLMFKKESVTKLLFSIFLDVIYYFQNSYIHLKYNYSKELLNNGKARKTMLIAHIFREEIKIIWNYEKLYGVSFIVYRIIFNKFTADEIYAKYYWFYLQGVKKLGVNFMKRYDKVIVQMKELYKCTQFFKMDLRRLIGYKKEEWLLDIEKEVNYLKLNEKLQDFLKSEIESKIYYRKVPKNYMFTFGFYNRIFYNFELLISIRNNQLLELQKESRVLDNIDTLVVNLAKEAGFIRKDKYMLLKAKELNDDLQKIDEGCAKYVDYNINNLIIADDYENYDYKFFKDLCEEIKLEYDVEFFNFKDEYVLISEKYIKEYIKKYVEKKEIRLIIWEE